MPTVKAVEIAQHIPHHRGWRIDNRALDHVRHASTSEYPFQRIEAALKNIAADVLDKLGLPLLFAIELGGPFDESLFAIGDGGQPQGRDIIGNSHRRFQDRIGAKHVEVRQAEKFFAYPVAVAQAKISNAADL